MTRDPNQQPPASPDDPLDVRPEPQPTHLPPPVAKVVGYARPGQHYTPPRPPTSPLYFIARAVGGFFLFFATIVIAGYIAKLLGSVIGFFCVVATAFAALVVVSFIFHRRGWLTGWLTGFFLAASLVGLVIYTCRNGWH
jgi:hypothetical protein